MSGRSKHVERGLLAQLVFEDYPLKVFSVLLSVALYLLVHSDEDAERTVDYDVVAVLPPGDADRVLVSELPARVRVTLRGPRSRIDALQLNELKAIPMDLRNHALPTFTFDPRLIAAPSRVQIVRVDPDHVDVRWRPRAERTFQVRVQLVGAPQPGFVATVVRVGGPTSVVISGPEDEVAAAAATVLFTDEVSIAGLGAGTYQLPTKQKFLVGHLTYVGVTATDVKVEIRPELRGANDR